MTPPGVPDPSAEARGEPVAVPPPGEGVTIISGKPDPDAVGLAPARRRRHGKRFRPEQHRSREHRRRRRRRLGRRAYIRSVFALPSLATLGNAVCGFASIYVASLDSTGSYPDPITRFFASNNYIVAAYLVFIAMICDALDGRLARFARHTTDFGGQLDSLADVISFGVAPAFLAIQVFKAGPHPYGVLPVLSRLIWAISALYMSCAAMRLARFNVSNSHGEQAHFSFLGLPSPGAGGAVVGFVLLQQELHNDPFHGYATHLASILATTCTWLLPLVVLSTGLLMVSNLRYGHMVNRYLRGRRSFAKVIWVLVLVLLFVVAHRYVIALCTLAYAFAGPVGYVLARARRSPAPAPAS